LRSYSSFSTFLNDYNNSDHVITPEINYDEEYDTMDISEPQIYEKFIVLPEINKNFWDLYSAVKKFNDKQTFFTGAQEWYKNFKSSPEYKVLKGATHHINTLGSVLLRLSLTDKETEDEDDVIVVPLQASDTFESGSSLSHFISFLFDSPDFLLVAHAPLGRSLQSFVEEHQTAIGGRLMLLLTKLGYTPGRKAVLPC
jgi:hypothetical protein